MQQASVSLCEAALAVKEARPEGAQEQIQGWDLVLPWLPLSCTTQDTNQSLWLSVPERSSLQFWDPTPQVERCLSEDRGDHDSEVICSTSPKAKIKAGRIQRRVCRAPLFQTMTALLAKKNMRPFLQTKRTTRDLSPGGWGLRLASLVTSPRRSE